ncbi:MAG: hypothetical protein L3V56_09865 [Candidatus Magnetoovum sp. WYHC-5]|nr:hypothetical protein [Candidatus Magnetoovum sp. WYHC-5]
MLVRKGIGFGIASLALTVLIMFIMPDNGCTQPLMRGCCFKNITPYGDYIPSQCNYGMRGQMMGTNQAIQSLEDYYNKFGFTVQIENTHGRFIRASIKDKETTIDIIILDRHSGRIRSIY